MHRLFTMFILALLAVLPVWGEDVDSLQVLLQMGDSCMQQYNTFEALKYYRQAWEMKDTIDVRTKLADCYYKRGDYRQTADLLKLVPEDSLSHDAFRQLAQSYQKQGDTDSYIYWAGQLLGHFPMDGEIVAGLTLAYAKTNQPQRGIICGMKYSQRDSANILVNRALADAWFMNRDFTAASKLYGRLLEQGDSTRSIPQACATRSWKTWSGPIIICNWPSSSVACSTMAVPIVLAWSASTRSAILRAWAILISPSN